MKIANISVNDLMEQVMILLKDEILANYKREEEVLQMQFPGGQKFEIIGKEV